jgi:hypothetical protein
MYLIILINEFLMLRYLDHFDEYYDNDIMIGNMVIFFNNCCNIDELRIYLLWL